MLKEVLIEPSCTAKKAEEIINNALTKYNTEETHVEFELLIEGSMSFGSHTNTYYTVVIEIYDGEPE